ncbi:MAG: radical SAM protein [Anaerolineae bacterium]|nr:radical SAM protein [Anaerolineae bacterium]
MEFPRFISFTITNVCNLRCRMCGQWSEEGYIYNGIKSPHPQMELADWKRLVDEVAAYDVASILIRGGEPFLFPDLIELLDHIHSKGIYISIDTNGTQLEKYAADLVRIGDMHITFSVDGPEEIHDQVRGVRGTYQKLKANIALLHELEKDKERKISKSICFTISPYSYRGLGEMPDVVRSMAIGSINIVPYYYFPTEVGKKYEEELEENFNCPAFSWKGFHHDDSGIDFNVFKDEYRKYLAGLDEVYDFPYMPLTEDDYRLWFGDATTPVGSLTCMNVEKLIDIQPNGDANFCVDFPDYCIGNVKEASIEALWNGSRASRFRSYRRERPLAICYRCGAKYISELKV